MKIKLDTVTKVKDFVRIIETNDIRATLSHGKYRVDAGSILGVLSLDLTNTLELKVEDTEDTRRVEMLLNGFLVV